MRRPARYTWVAPFYDALSGEWPVYRAGRRRGVEALRLRPGMSVLDLGCGTGLDFALLQEALGPTGRIVGVDASPWMLAAARRRCARRGWTTVRLVGADATRVGAGTLRAALADGGRRPYADAVLATYTLSIMAGWPAAWRTALSVAAPGARVCVVDMTLPERRGPARAAARAAMSTAGADPAAHPWRAVEAGATDVERWSLRAGHVQVRAGTLP